MKAITPFVVACLPRSGSAWLVTALNSLTSLYVEHEGFGNHHKAGLRIVDPPFDASVGSDVLIPSLGEQIPYNWNHYFLYRDPDECEQSLKKIGLTNYDGWVTQCLWAERYVDIYQPKVLFYKDMENTIRVLIEENTNELYGFNRAKLNQLLNMRITSRHYGN